MKPYWYHPIYHLASYKECYFGTLPDIGTKDRLTPELLMPPECRRPMGRPKQGRYEAYTTKQHDRQQRCLACYQYGHLQKDCKTPSTKVRVVKHQRRLFRLSRQSATVRRVAKFGKCSVCNSFELCTVS